MSQEQPNAEELARLSKPVYAPRKKWQRPPVKDQDASPADGDSNAKELQTGLWEGLAAEAARSAAVWSEHRTAAAAGGDGPLYLSIGNCCDEVVDDLPFDRSRVDSPEDLGEIIGSLYRLRPCRCRNNYCPFCGPRLGVKQYIRLLRRVQTFKSVFGVTLTLDGSLFSSPEQGWSYVMNERLLSRYVRELKRGNWLSSGAYYWSVEFQPNTQQAHWHMLLDAENIPHGVLVELWSRYRPSFAPPLDEPITAQNYKGRPPAFGSVFFSPPRNRAKAAYYATKYLTKYPEKGYFDWVLDHQGRMPRYGHSHRFFVPVPNHDPMCFCRECCGEVEATPRTQPKRKPKSEQPAQRKELSTIRERLNRCGKECTVVKVPQVRLPDGSVVDGKPKFEGKLALPLEVICEHYGITPAEYWELGLLGEEVTELEELAGQRPPSKEAA